MRIDTTWTVTTEYHTGVAYAERVSRHGLALAMQDAAMKHPKVVRCEIRDNVTGLVRGRTKPVSVPSPERTDDFNREYDIAPWAFNGE